MLDWVQAVTCDLTDCRHLVRVYCPKVEVADDLLEKIRVETRGCTRRICVNLDHIREYALGHSLKQIDAASYKGSIYTGRPEGR